MSQTSELKNIKILKTGLNVSKIKRQLEEYKSDWGGQMKLSGTELLDDKEYIVSADVLQLIVGGLEHAGQYVGDSEKSVIVPAYYHHTEVIAFVKRHFKKVDRCGFLALPVGGEVGRHIDFGTYYLTRDRYHLSIQGKYLYTCGDESVVIEPGTLMWFNNKLEHSATNIGDDVRITFVFDVPYVKGKSAHQA